MQPAVDCELMIQADDTCLMFQHKYINEIVTVLNKNFSMLCDWFVAKKLSNHFGEDEKNQIYLVAANIKLRDQNH